MTKTSLTRAIQSIAKSAKVDCKSMRNPYTLAVLMVTNLTLLTSSAIAQAAIDRAQRGRIAGGGREHAACLK